MADAVMRFHARILLLAMGTDESGAGPAEVRNVRTRPEVRVSGDPGSARR